MLVVARGGTGAWVEVQQLAHHLARLGHCKPLSGDWFSTSGVVLWRQLEEVKSHKNRSFLFFNVKTHRDTFVSSKSDLYLETFNRDGLVSFGFDRSNG